MFKMLYKNNNNENLEKNLKIIKKNLNKYNFPSNLT